MTRFRFHSIYCYDSEISPKNGNDGMMEISSRIEIKQEIMENVIDNWTKWWTQEKKFIYWCYDMLQFFLNIQLNYQNWMIMAIMLNTYWIMRSEIFFKPCLTSLAKKMDIGC